MTTELSVELSDDLYEEFSAAMHEFEETESDLVRGLIRDWVAEQRE